jgi:hypothetical protein
MEEHSLQQASFTVVAFHRREKKLLAGTDQTLGLVAGTQLSAQTTSCGPAGKAYISLDSAPHTAKIDTAEIFMVLFVLVS